MNDVIVRIRELGDSALVVEFDGVAGDHDDVMLNERAVALANVLRERAIEGVRDVVPTFRTVGVYCDPLGVDQRLVAAQVESAVRDLKPGPAVAPATHEIPVRYGGERGPDLADVASAAGLSEDDVVRLHAGRTYRVFMMGFSPGFAYLGKLDPVLVLPRRAVPRTIVPVGSVAIAGEHTGVYPSATPGGWHLIGHTSVCLFDLARSEPFLIKAGDYVRFAPL